MPILWLASYPKSGNTWFRALLTAYEDSDGDVDINRLDGRHAARERLFERYLACDGSLLTTEETYVARRAIYLHLAQSETSGVPQKVHAAAPGPCRRRRPQPTHQAGGRGLISASAPSSPFRACKRPGPGSRAGFDDRVGARPPADRRMPGYPFPANPALPLFSTTN